MKTVYEQIEIMQYFADDDGIVERTELGKDNWRICNNEVFNWEIYDYRKKEQKKTITIERWLIKNGERFDVGETSSIKDYMESCVGWEKVKLLDSYEVEL